MRISFEVSGPDDDEGGTEIHIYLDAAGREYLVRELMKLEYPINDHFHLFSEAWMGSGELTEERQVKASLIGRHVKAMLRPDNEELFSP